MISKEEYNAIIERYVKKVRDKAIDKFAEKICDRTSEASATIVKDGIEFDVVTVDFVTELAWEIAEEMRCAE